MKKMDFLRLAALAVVLLAGLLAVTQSLRLPNPRIVIPTLAVLPSETIRQVAAVPTDSSEVGSPFAEAPTLTNSLDSPIPSSSTTLESPAASASLEPTIASQTTRTITATEIETQVASETTTTVIGVLPTAFPFPTLPIVSAPTFSYIEVPLPQAPVLNQVVITFKADTSIQERQAYIESLGGEVKQSIDALNTVIVEVPQSIANTTLPQSATVAQTESDYYVSALVAVPPSDPYYDQQWALPVIGAPQAWLALPPNAPKVTVAVIDSGICANNPDLTGRILPGWDFVENDNQPQDAFGHGCGVSGIIAANDDDGIGMAGVAPNAMILPLRVLNAQGIGTYSDVAAAIVYAADNGAQVINLSLGGTNPSSMLEQAVDYAISKGVTIVAAAGNTGGVQVLYPAAYEPVISVGSVDQNLQVSSFSSGSTNVDLLAPGRDILSTKLDGSYGLMSGTSFAAPQVAGVAALEIVLGEQLTIHGGIAKLVLPLPTIPIVTEMPSPVPTIQATSTSELADYSAGEFEWSPNANIVAFWKRNTLPGSPGMNSYDLVLLNADSNNQQVLMANGNAGAMTFAPDGTKLWFWYNQIPYEANPITGVVREISTDEMPISTNLQVEADSDASFNGSTNKLSDSFTRLYRVFPNNGELILENRSVGGLTQLTNNAAVEVERIQLYSLSVTNPDVEAQTNAADAFDFPICAPDFSGCNIAGSYDQSHPGHDYNGNCGGDCDLGWPVTAAANGRVVYSDYVPGNYTWGNLIMIEHTLPNGSKVWSVYAHLNTRLVGANTDISRGQQIGTVGKGANNQFPAHLHFEMRTQYFTAYAWQYGGDQWYNYYTNPTDFINAHRHIAGSSCPGPSLNNPSQDAILTSQTITFSWSASSGCTFSGYQFRINDSSNMEDSPFIDTGEGATSHTVTIDSSWNNRDLWWGVRTSNPLSPNWSVRHFRIQPSSGTDCNGVSYNGVIFYEATNCNQGDRSPLQFSSTGFRNLTDYNFNDAATSIYVGSGWSVKIFENTDQAGASRCITGSMWDLSKDNYDSSSRVINNDISSAEVFNNNSCTGLPPYTVWLFVDANYGGSGCYLSNAGSSNVCSSINDLASSMRVKSGWSARVWADANQSGSSRCFTSDISDFGGLQYNENGGGNVNDSISSFAAYNQSSCPSLVTAPSAPTLNTPVNNATVNRDTSVVLFWNSTNGATEYYAEFSGGPNIALTQTWTSNTSWTIGGMWGGVYTWRVKAHNSAGESGWSETRTLTIQYGVPTNLSALVVSPSQINLSWNASADAPGNIDGYRIYRNGSAAGTVGSSTTTFNDTSLNCNTGYAYIVRAYKANLDSADSDTVITATQACDTLPNITTQPQSQTINGGQTATLSVVATGTTPLSYQWYRGIAPSTTNPVGTNSSSFTTPALTTTTSYWVRVSNSYGNANSNTATITIAPIPANDLMANATIVSVLPRSITQDPFGSTTSGTDPTSCASYVNSVWFKYTASATQPITITTQGSSYDTVLAAYTGSAGNLTMVGCDDDSGTVVRSWLGLNVTSGTTYYMMVGQYGSTALAGAATLMINFSAVPTGDSLALYNPTGSKMSLIDTLQDFPPSEDFTTFGSNAPAVGSGWVMGDWDGDGQKTPGLWNNGVFWLTNSIGSSTAWTGIWLGLFPSSAPVAGRFDTSVNHDCFGVVELDFQPPNMGFPLHYRCDFSTTAGTLYGQWLGIALSGSDPYQFSAGDFDHNGFDSLVAQRGTLIAWGNVTPSTGVGTFPLAQYIGTPHSGTSQLVAGDWNNDGIDSFGLYYPADGFFYRRNDLDWNSGVYFLQHVGLPIGNALAASYRAYQGSAFGVAQAAELEVTKIVTPEATDTVEATEIITPEATDNLEATETVTPVVTETPTDSTAPETPEVTETPTALPTALPFPTLPPPATQTDLPTEIPLSLPAVATFDDGASDWLHSQNWQLVAHESGLAWFMTSKTTETLRWQESIDLRGVQTNVALSFQSQFAGDGIAAVQVSTDEGATWLPVAAIPTSETWTTVSVDLSGYNGSVVQIEFTWQDGDPNTTDQWAVDNVVIDAVMPTLVAPSETPLPTATETPTTVGTEVIDVTAEANILPTSELSSS